MAKSWDIKPPYRKEAKVTPNKSKTSKSRIWSYLLLILALIGVLYLGASVQQELNREPEPTPSAPSATPLVKTNLSLKILNSTGRFEESNKVKDLLSTSGYKVSAVENTINTYNQTIVYYTPLSEPFLDEIMTILKDYKPSYQKFTQTSSYDIAIIIGNTP